MTEAPEPDHEAIEAAAGHHEVLKEGWAATLEDMRAMAADREDQGWEVATVGAGDTAPEHPDVGEENRWGLVYVIPGNKEAEFREAFDEGGFPEYDVYRSVAEGFEFIVTELRDPDSRTAIFIAGQFDLRKARPLIETARAQGEMWTHVQKLDGTKLGSFRHDDHGKFFPDA